MTTPMPPAPRWPDTIQRYLNEGYLDEVHANHPEFPDGCFSAQFAL